MVAMVLEPRCRWRRWDHLLHALGRLCSPNASRSWSSSAPCTAFSPKKMPAMAVAMMNNGATENTV